MRAREVISSAAKKNRGLVRAPSSLLRISIIGMILILFLNKIISSPNLGQNFLEQSSKRFTQREEGLFLKPLPLVEEPSILVISQGNTLQAVSPLHHPRQQVLGVMTPIEPVEEREIISYTVQTGDTLSGIASRFGISQNTIIWANNLNRTAIRPGQELIILPISGLFHLVEREDSIEKIANRYQAEVEEILAFNEINKNELREGDIIIIPGGKKRRPVPAANHVSPPMVSSRSASLQPSSSWLIPPTSGIITQKTFDDMAVDIANRCGTPIFAVAAGVIQRTGYHSIAGRYIRVLHPNGVVSFYAHLSEISVSQGEPVSQGDLILSLIHI